MRKFTTYEFNHLQRFGFDPIKLEDTVEEDIPVEYITGKCEFRGEVFKVTKDTLIPRVETEELINIALEYVEKWMRQNRETFKFADVGTGSGAIGISFAKELKKRNIPFEACLSDISDKALEVAKSNVQTILGKEEGARGEEGVNLPAGKAEVRVRRADLLEGYPQDAQFDLIFANLPYIPAGRFPELDNSVKYFEPHLALDGGPDGLKYVRKLLNQAPKYLSQGGILLLEVDDSHTDSSEFQNTYHIEILQDINLKNRYWICKKLQLI